MFFEGWSSVGRVVLSGLLAYIALVVFLRVSGKRTLAKMNAFDLVVTVALGSTLAATMLDEEISLVQGAAAFLTLIGAQFLITWLSLRSARVKDLVKARPRLVFFHGDFREEAMRRERVTRSEILAAVRSEGNASMDDVAAVVLETNGRITVLKTEPVPDGGMLGDVEGFDAPDGGHGEGDRDG